MTEGSKRGVEHPIKRAWIKKAIVSVGGVTAASIGAEVARQHMGQPLQTTVLTEVAPTPTLVEPPIQEMVQPILTDAAMVFAKGYDTKDTQEYIQQVVKEKENILKNRYEDGSVEGDKQKVHAWQGHIDSAVASLQPPVASFISKILPGLIFIESKGDEHAHIAGNTAVGLCQITPTVLADLENVYPGFTKGKDIETADDNIAIAAKYLDHLYKTFPDPALAVWAYHVGQTRFSRAMYNYIVVEKKLLTEQAYDTLPPPQTIGLVNKFKQELTTPKFMDSVSLAIEIRQQYTDEGLRAGALRYVPLVAAGSELLAA